MQPNLSFFKLWLIKVFVLQMPECEVKVRLLCFVGPGPGIRQLIFGVTQVTSLILSCQRNFLTQLLLFFQRAKLTPVVSFWTNSRHVRVRGLIITVRFFTCICQNTNTCALTLVDAGGNEMFRILLLPEWQRRVETYFVFGFFQNLLPFLLLLLLKTL